MIGISKELEERVKEALKSVGSQLEDEIEIPGFPGIILVKEVPDGDILLEKITSEKHGVVFVAMKT